MIKKKKNSIRQLKEGMFLYLINPINKNHTTNIVINGERLKAPAVISQKKSMISTFATSIQCCTTIFAKVIRRKINKKHPCWKRSTSIHMCQDLVYGTF